MVKFSTITVIATLALASAAQAQVYRSPLNAGVECCQTPYDVPGASLNGWTETDVRSGRSVAVERSRSDFERGYEAGSRQ